MIKPVIENDLKHISLNDVNYADYIKENYIQIPDNATNGDMIKTVFPNIKINDNEYFYYMYSSLDDGKKLLATIDADKKWWNSPYKADKEIMK